MTETDIRYAFDRATEDLSVPPDLLDRVRAGGRRRVIRRRSLLAGGLAVAAGGAAAPVAVHRLENRGEPVASPRLDRPIRGDLAGDEAFLRRVRAFWQRRVEGMGTYGEAHVSWAGTTPVGSAVALLAQRTRIMGEPGGTAQYGLTGFVEVIGDDWQLTGPAPMSTGDPGSSAFLAGPDRDLLLVVDEGYPVDFSPAYTIDGQGRIVRDFQRLGVNADGVSSVTVPSQLSGVRIAVREPGSGRRVDVANADSLTGEALAALSGGVGNQIPELIERRLPGYEKAWPAGATLRRDNLDGWNVATLPAYDDRYGTHRWDGPSEWFIAGATPDRRRLVVQARPLDGDARVFVFLGEAGGPRYAGLLSTGLSTEVPDETTGTLGVLHVRLPQQQGIVVAALNATLLYQVKDSGWLAVTGDAALLPAAATALRVQPRRGRPVTLGLL
ncbi:hypothetical protein ACWKSP_17045 [Micromonosporaceae bacterium Da 78-11]